MTEPLDRYNLVYILFFLHGLSSLVPWNMMINAYDYFVNYKIKVNSQSSDRLKVYNTNFVSYLGIACKAPNLLFQIINMCITTKVFCCMLSMRITFSLVIQLYILGFTLLLAILDTQAFPEAFFWMTITSNAVLNVANGIYQSTLFGSVADMPIEYINAVSLGMNISGLVIAIANILSLAVTPDPQSMGIIYFGSAVLILFGCFLFDNYLKTNEFRVYYETLVDKSPVPVEKVDSWTSNKYLIVFLNIYPELLNIFLTLFVSLSIFPAIMANIESSNHWISDKYFGPVFCFLVFNLFTFIGTITAQYIHYPSPETMVFFTSIRLLFIPFYLFFNYKPKYIDRKLPVLIKNDFIYLLVNCVLGLTNGHLPALSMMYAPKQVPIHLAPTAAMMSSFMILIGILSGIYFSLIFPKIV